MIKMKTTYLHTDREGHHYRLTLYYKKRQLTTPWQCGVNAGEPTVGDVIYCLVYEYWTAQDNPTYEDFLLEYGYDHNSVNKKLYNTFIRQSEKLEKFLGDDLEDFCNLVSDHDELLEAL